MIEGTYCTFDTSACEERAKYAKELVAYGDGKIPQLFETLGFDRGDNKVNMFFGGENQHGYLGNWSVQIAKNIPENDWGTVIHEAVHITQEPGVQVLYFAQPKFKLLYEGVADYYRVLLSSDRQGDHHDDSKRSLHACFSLAPEHIYESGPEFVAYLRHCSKDPTFPKALNDNLRTGDPDAIDEFLRDRVGFKYDTLLAGYPNARARDIKRPIRTNRFDFFTAMMPTTLK